MKTARKINGHAKLKTLPEERQEVIAAYALQHTVPATLAWLRKDGLETSASALKRFLSWWQLHQQLRQDEATTETLLEQFKKEVPALTEEQLDELGQRTFSLLCIRRQDLAGFVRIRSARRKALLDNAKFELSRQAEERHEREFAFAQLKFQWDAAAECLKQLPELRAIAADPQLDPAAKLEQIRLRLFGELPA